MCFLERGRLGESQLADVTTNGPFAAADTDTGWLGEFGALGTAGLAEVVRWWLLELGCSVCEAWVDMTDKLQTWTSFCQAPFVLQLESKGVDLVLSVCHVQRGPRGPSVQGACGRFLDSY